MTRITSQQSRVSWRGIELARIRHTPATPPMLLKCTLDSGTLASAHLEIDHKTTLRVSFYNFAVHLLSLLLFLVLEVRTPFERVRPGKYCRRQPVGSNARIAVFRGAAEITGTMSLQDSDNEVPRRIHLYLDVPS